MPSIASKDKDLLDTVSDPVSKMASLNINQDDLAAWEYSKEYPSSEDSIKIREHIASKSKSPNNEHFSKVMGAISNPSSVMEEFNLDDTDLQAWAESNKNPKNPDSIGVRNHIYDKVAASKPESLSEQGGLPSERFWALNFLDGDVEAQRAYYEKNGYQTRVSTKGEVQVRRGVDEVYKPIDIKDADWWDLTDFVWDVGAGLAIGSAQALAAGGAGAAATAAGGPVSGAITALAAGSAAGAGAGMLQETLKQAAANFLGLRKDYNYHLISNAAVIGGTIPVGTEMAKKGLSIFGELASKAVFGTKLQPHFQEIIDATKALGGDPVTGQLYDNQRIKYLEDMQKQSSFTLGGITTRKNSELNYKAARAAASEIVDSAATKTNTEIGDEIGYKLKQAVANKLAPIEANYAKFEAELGNRPIDDVKMNIFGEFDSVIQEFKFSPEAQEAVLKFRNAFSQEKNPVYSDITRLRSNIGNAARSARDKSDHETSKALSDMYDRITDMRGLALDYFQGGANNISKTTRAEIAATDKAYGKVMNEVSIILDRNLNHGHPEREIGKWLDKYEESSRAMKILRLSDVKGIMAIKESFPEIYEIARTSKIREIAKASEVGGEIIPRKLSKIISGLEPETADLLFGSDGVKQAKNLKTYLDSLPPNRLVGPSGTPGGSEMFKSGDWFSAIFTPAGWLSQIKSVSRSVEIKARTMGNPARPYKPANVLMKGAATSAVLIPDFDMKLEADRIGNKIKGDDK